MKKLIAVLIFSLLTSVAVLAQTAVDALRYSRLTFGGTARYMALNGAYGAIGADFTVLSTNPAGIGLYKSSEFTITPAIFSGSTESSYNGVISDDNRVNFNLSNTGLVFSRKIHSKTKNNDWRYVNFGMGLNRLNDFNRRMNITGPNNKSSLLDVYSQYANDYDIPYKEIEDDPYYMYAYDLNPAWWTFLLDMDTLNGVPTYINPITHKGSVQSLQKKSWGSMNEFVFSLGANYKDIMFVGATIGIPYIRYFEESYYVEEMTSPENDLSKFYYNTELETKASGFNFKIGLIIKPVEWLRIGGAVHTPTYYSNVRDCNRVYMRSEFKTPDLQGYTSYQKTNDWKKSYDLTTPFRAFGSIAFIIAPYGLISGEYEFADYSQAKFHDVAYWVNDDIKAGYTATHNFRVGTEWRFNIVSLRAGYAYYSSPYKSGINNGKINSFSGGLGFNITNYFIDLAYVYSISTEDYYLYNYDEYVAKAVNDLKSQRFLLTLGARF
jgi:hypothetical protein